MADEQQSSWTNKMGDALGICTVDATSSTEQLQAGSGQPAAGTDVGSSSGDFQMCQFPGADDVHIYREGELRSASEEHSDTLDTGLLDGAANPTNDQEMQKLIESKGGGQNASDMSPHERLKFLADNGLAPDLIPPRHRDLMKTDIPEAAKISLSRLGQDVHNGFDAGHGNYNIDEYSVILDKLPDGMTPQQFMNTFLANPNATADNWKFNQCNVFHAKQAGQNLDLAAEQGLDSGAPGVGDWYHINIPGNDGDVMIVDKDTDMEDGRISTTVQTMTDQEVYPTEDHPVSGRRQFGLEKLESGGYRFYTRGFDRAESKFDDTELSRDMQDIDWSSMMEGVAEKHGGRPEQVDELTGEPVWGWHEHHSAEKILESGVQSQEPCELNIE